MNITTDIPTEFWMTIASALWWGVMIGVLCKGIAAIFHSFGAFCRAAR